MERIRREIAENPGVRLAILFGVGVLFLGLYWLSLQQVCVPEFNRLTYGHDKVCYGYDSRVFWSAMTLNLVKYASIPVLLGAAFGWLRYSLKVWIISTVAFGAAVWLLYQVPT